MQGIVNTYYPECYSILLFIVKQSYSQNLAFFLKGFYSAIFIYIS